jgi:outer membrane protein OmpA-like peptidoglycan-associated protein
VQIVVFTDFRKMKIGGNSLHVKTFKSNQQADLEAFVKKVYSDGTTMRTMLYEGMLAGLELLRTSPDNGPRMLMVFSDGEDMNSFFNRDDVIEAAKKVRRLNVFAIDYMPGRGTDKFLTSFATANRGQVFKASSEEELIPVLQSVASKMSYFYVLTTVVSGKLDVAPGSLNIEETKTIDASPMLGQVFFAEGSSEIPSSYALFKTPEETAGFDELKFKDSMEKYSQVLNIVGKRMVDTPDVKLTLTGCNSDTGKEKGKKKLSTWRAEAVMHYLVTVWKIAPERITVVTRGLPAMPSAKWLTSGQAENRRVEIQASDPKFLAPVRTEIMSNRIDATELVVSQKVIPAEKIASWKLAAANNTGPLDQKAGNGAPGQKITLAIPDKDLNALAAGGDIVVKMDLTGKVWLNAQLTSDPVKVSFIQTSERVAKKQGLKVEEKYALLLFEFNKDTVSPLDKMILDKVAERVKTLPDATVQIIGHTDNIGKAEYNSKLSERRALAVYKILAKATGKDAAKRITYFGVGPKSPLYDNKTPEARSLNRTVTIVVKYRNAE